jgi:hypothetical protein
MMMRVQEHEIKEFNKIRELHPSAALGVSLQDKLPHQKRLRELKRRRSVYGADYLKSKTPSIGDDKSKPVRLNANCGSNTR